jgi:nucleoside-diphosphate-sugar epimerase
LIILPIRLRLVLNRTTTSGGIMNVLVVGASRGTGAAAVSALAQAGHLVTAFARSKPASRYSDPVRYVAGDVMDSDTLAKAMVGQDAVVVTLGISDNPFTVRLLRRATSPLDVRSRGTANVIEAMRAAGARRLIVQSTYGIGETYANLPLSLKAFFFVIKPQVADHVRQEELVRSSGLDWTVVRPVVLNDVETDTPAKVDLEDQVASLKVSRTQLARVLAQAVDRDDWHRQTVSVSA